MKTPTYSNVFFFNLLSPRPMPLLPLVVELLLDQSRGLGQALDLRAPHVLDGANFGPFQRE